MGHQQPSKDGGGTQDALPLTAELFSRDTFRERGSVNSVYSLVIPPLVTRMTLGKLNGLHNKVPSHEKGHGVGGKEGRKGVGESNRNKLYTCMKLSKS